MKAFRVGALLIGLTLSVSAMAAPPKPEPKKDNVVPNYYVHLVKGQQALVSGEKNVAVAEFKEAIRIDGSKMIGYYFLGESELESGNLDRAEEVWQTALAKDGPDALAAKVIFATADLMERKMKWQAAKDAWIQYGKFLEKHPKVKGFEQTAVERQNRVDQRMKYEVDYGAVKARIQKRQEEQEKEAIENAKKDTLNK